MFSVHCCLFCCPFCSLFAVRCSLFTVVPLPVHRVSSIACQHRTTEEFSRFMNKGTLVFVDYAYSRHKDEQDFAVSYHY